MPQLSTVTLKNTANVDVPFTPKSLIPGGGSFVDRSSGVAVSMPTLQLQSQFVPKNRLTKVRLRMNFPVLENVTGTNQNGISPAPMKAFDNGFDGVFFLHERSTSDQRGELLHQLKSWLASVDVEKFVVDQETYY
jgi:hypothetical protein